MMPAVPLIGFVTRNIKALGAAVLAAAIAFPLGHTIGHWRGWNAAETQIRATAHAEAIDRIAAMERNNAAFRKLDDRERCVVLMRSSGLPDDACD